MKKARMTLPNVVGDRILSTVWAIGTSAMAGLLSAYAHLRCHVWGRYDTEGRD